MISQETLAILVTCALLWLVAFWCDWHQVLRPRRRKAATPAATSAHTGAASAPAAVPFLITAAMRARLQALGLVDAEIDRMTPADAWKLLDEVDPQPGDRRSTAPAEVTPSLDDLVMCPIVCEEMKRRRAAGAILVPRFRYLTFGGAASCAGRQPVQSLYMDWPTVVYARSATGPLDRVRVGVRRLGSYVEHWDAAPVPAAPGVDLPLASLFWGSAERPAVIALGKFLDTGCRVDVEVETLDDGVEVSLGFWCVEELSPVSARPQHI